MCTVLEAAGPLAGLASGGRPSLDFADDRGSLDLENRRGRRLAIVVIRLNNIGKKRDRSSTRSRIHFQLKAWQADTNRTLLPVRLQMSRQPYGSRLRNSQTVL